MIKNWMRQNVETLFSDAGYEDYAGEIEAELNERYCIVESAKLFTTGQYWRIFLGEYKSISEQK